MAYHTHIRYCNGRWSKVPWSGQMCSTKFISGIWGGQCWLLITMASWQTSKSR